MNQHVKPPVIDLTETETVSPAAAIVESHLERQIDEISAIASLLGMAGRLPHDRRFGWDMDQLNEVMLRRVRKLASACQDAVSVILRDDCDPESLAEIPDDRDHFED